MLPLLLALLVVLTCLPLLAVGGVLLSMTLLTAAVLCGDRSGVNRWLGRRTLRLTQAAPVAARATRGWITRSA